MIEIDIDGPQGNAFSLMADANHIGRMLGMDKDEIDEVCKEMRSGDYDHLLHTFYIYFGDVATLIKGGEPVFGAKQ
jgi:hypothetical protein